MKRPEYHHLIAKGVAPKLAEMLSSGVAPAAKDDTQFARGNRTPYGLPDNPASRKVAAMLRARGADPSGVYLTALANRTADPKAVVHGRDDIKKVCKERGWGCEGTVKVSQIKENLDPGPGVGVAPDLIEKRLKKEAELDPGCVSTPKKAQETRRKIRDRIKPHWVRD